MTPSYPRVLTLESDDWTDPITGEFDVDRIRLPTEVSSLRVSRAFSQLAVLKQKKGDPLTPEKARVWIRRLVEIGEEKGYFALRDAVERESKKKAPPKKYEYTDTFQKWWATYPSLRRTNKPKAFDQYKAAIERLLETEKVTIDGQPGTIEIASREAAEQFLLRRVTAYAKSPRGQSQFSPEPERWLRNAKFLEGREAWSVGDDETTPVKDREFRRAPPPT